jgi:Zn-dependent M28 family amino/carboxypeptidase
VEKTGAECHLEHFLSGFAPNVICFYPTLLNSTDLVVISSHFDSRGSWGQTRAPGADDDGSGSGQLLAITEAIKNQNIQFEHQLVVAFFAGEEQGLLGSHAFAGE